MTTTLTAPLSFLSDEVDSLWQIRSALWHGEAEVHAAADLSQEPLRDVNYHGESGHGNDSGRAGSGGKTACKTKSSLVESQRIHWRTRFDLEMMKSLAIAMGIENYSPHFSGRKTRRAPVDAAAACRAISLCLLTSRTFDRPAVARHVVPATGLAKRTWGIMDPARHRPWIIGYLKFLEEFEERTNQIIYVSATPRAV